MSGYRASITFDGPSDGGANYKVQISAYGCGIYVAVPIMGGSDNQIDIENAKREAIGIAAHLVSLINESIPA